jgi:tRNA1Val (adenine37-N6)-methyltransferase
MPNPFFKFKNFTVWQDKCAMKVTTDSCLFGAWVAEKLSKQNIEHALDIGTGTGLLPLMLQQKININKFDAVEIDCNAATQAIQNFTASSYKNLHVYNTAIQGFTAAVKYDLIISNPPFYENSLPSANALKNIAHHGTELLLADLLSISNTLLTKNGWLALLLPYYRMNELEQLLRNNQMHIAEKCKVKPSLQHNYFRVMYVLTHTKLPTNNQSLAIKDENNNYTAAFTKLLQPYYLYL